MMLFLYILLAWSLLFTSGVKHVYCSLIYNLTSTAFLTYHYYHSDEKLYLTKEGTEGPLILFVTAYNGIAYNFLDIVRILCSGDKSKQPFIAHHIGTIACVATSILNANFQEMYKFYLLLEISSIVYNIRLVYPPNKGLARLNKLVYLTIRPYAVYIGYYILRDELKRYPDDYYSGLLYTAGYILVSIFTLFGLTIAICG